MEALTPVMMVDMVSTVVIPKTEKTIQLDQIKFLTMNIIQSHSQSYTKRTHRKTIW